MRRTNRRLIGWIGSFALLAAGCHSSGASSPNGLFATGPTRVPPPTTGSYGKAAGYYPANTASGANKAATPSPTAGASMPLTREGEVPLSNGTVLPATPPTEIAPAVHVPDPSRSNVSYSVAPATAISPASVPPQTQDVDRMLAPVPAPPPPTSASTLQWGVK